MKLYAEIARALFNKFVLKKSNGMVVKEFAENGGVAYIKLAQILATQNINNLFSEEDRLVLSSICDNCKPISFRLIKKVLKREYGKELRKIFRKIDKKPLGSASVSQVHKAQLMNGDVVALKIKRQDIVCDIKKDINMMRKLVHKYGKLFGFLNFKGADLALDLYSTWILEEIDFDRERVNVKKYLEYAESVNGKVLDVCDLRVPKVYDEYSTSNIIVMEFVDGRTINSMKLTNENKSKIVNAINSYIKLNFWAMFNDRPICFHGDPHSGNLAIDDVGNLWFLDFGLIFMLSEDEAKLCRDYFLTIYNGDYEKLYSMLVIYGDLNDFQKKEFKKSVKEYVYLVRDKNVTHYFIDLIGICLSFDFVPPSFFVNMSKAFICIYGICNFSDNEVDAKKLLNEQVFLFMFKECVSDFISNFNRFNDYLTNFLREKF